MLLNQTPQVLIKANRFSIDRSIDRFIKFWWVNLTSSQDIFPVIFFLYQICIPFIPAAVVEAVEAYIYKFFVSHEAVTAWAVNHSISSCENHFQSFFLLLLLGHFKMQQRASYLCLALCPMQKKKARRGRRESRNIFSGFWIRFCIFFLSHSLHSIKRLD